MNLFIPMLISGLLISVHCVFMCGGMVMTYAVKGAEEGPLMRRLLPHFAYQGSKILSYTLVGLLLGGIGSIFNVGPLRGWVTVVAAVYMVLLGLNMTGKFPALNRLTPRPPKFLMKALMRLRKKADADAAAGESTLMTPVMFGLMTGFMPCGPLQTAQVAAAGTASPLYGAVAMLGFGLGTAPLMLGFGAVAGLLSGRFKKALALVSAVVIMGLGLVMLNRGAMLVGSPVTFNSIKSAVVGTAPQTAGQTEYKAGADGVVEVPLVIENTQFQPSAVSIPADKKVRLVVDRREDNACSAQIAIRQLGVLQNLTPNGTTIVELPASKAGAYTLTCGMGMMSGQLQVGGGAVSGSSGAPVLPLALIALALGGGAYALHRRGQLAAEQAKTAKKSSRKAAGSASGKTSGSASHRGSSAHRPGDRSDVAHEPAPSLVFNLYTSSEFMLLTIAVVAAVVAGFVAAGLRF